jgi:hypothetical protein
MCKVTKTDCFDSCKLSKSHLALEKRNVQVKLRWRVKTGLILETITKTGSNATRILVDNLRKLVNCWVPGHNPVVSDCRCVTADGSDHWSGPETRQVTSEVKQIVFRSSEASWAYVAKIRMEKNVDGSPSSVMDKGQHWHKNLRARTTRFHKKTVCSVK